MIHAKLLRLQSLSIRSLRLSSPTLGAAAVDRVVDEPLSRLSFPTLTAAAAGRE